MLTKSDLNDIRHIVKEGIENDPSIVRKEDLDSLSDRVDLLSKKVTAFFSNFSTLFGDIISRVRAVENLVKDKNGEVRSKSNLYRLHKHISKES